MSTLKTKSRLGRGLSSLISISEAAPAESEVPMDMAAIATVAMMERRAALEVAAKAAAELVDPPATASLPARNAVIEIPLDRIVPNPHQPRRVMNEATLAELAASLKTTGLIQPIVVRKVGEGYELIAGERRWRAARMASLPTVPAIVRDSTSIEQAMMALVENIQRENLNAIDRALAYKTLMTQLGLTQVELATRIGEDRSSIANHLRLLDLSGPVQALVADGRLSMGHAKILAGLTSHPEQERLAQLVIDQSLSVRNLERQIQQPSVPVAPKPTTLPSAHLQELEKSMASQLGLRVQVRAAAKKGHGRLVLHYSSLAQFDELVARLGVKMADD